MVVHTYIIYIQVMIFVSFRALEYLSLFSTHQIEVVSMWINTYSSSRTLIQYMCNHAYHIIHIGIYMYKVYMYILYYCTCYVLLMTKFLVPSAPVTLTSGIDNTIVSSYCNSFYIQCTYVHIHIHVHNYMYMYIKCNQKCMYMYMYLNTFNVHYRYMYMYKCKCNTWIMCMYICLPLL